MSPLLKVRDLTISFPTQDAVRGVSFDVQPGETLAIVGESGSGKSITAFSIMQLLPAAARITGGSIEFDGRDIARLSEGEMRDIRGKDIAMVFQEPMSSLNPVMTVGRQITEVLLRHEPLSRAAARRKAIELLDLVRIPDAHRRVDAYPHEMSGGMRQRVMTAIAVACRPRLLIADEPTTALDVTIQAQVLALLDRLRRELSMSMILITHDLGVVAEWADRVVVMYSGNTVEKATPQALSANAIHPYTQGLFAASPRLKADYHYSDGPLAEIPGSISSAIGERGCAFAPRCPLMLESCRQEVPPLVPVADGREVACPVVLNKDSANVVAFGE